MNEGTVRQLAEMHALLAELEALKVAVKAMEVCNDQRAARGMAQGYGEHAFDCVRIEMELIAKRLRDEI